MIDVIEHLGTGNEFLGWLPPLEDSFPDLKILPFYLSTKKSNQYYILYNIYSKMTILTEYTSLGRLMVDRNESCPETRADRDFVELELIRDKWRLLICCNTFKI